MKLTERVIQELSPSPGKKDQLVFDDDQRELGVRIAHGGKTYLAQYTLNGKRKRLPLGSCSAISLKQARAAAMAAMGDVAKGKIRLTSAEKP